MSREVDPNDDNLSDDDKAYLAQRGQLSIDVMTVEEQRKLLDLETTPLEQMANTGTAATMTVEELEAELERRRAEQPLDIDTSKLFTNPGGVAGATADDDDDDDDPVVEPPYDQHSKGLLIAEINRRNESRSDDDQLDTTGNKPALVEALENDDEGE